MSLGKIGSLLVSTVAIAAAGCAVDAAESVSNGAEPLSHEISHLDAKHARLSAYDMQLLMQSAGELYGDLDIVADIGGEIELSVQAPFVAGKGSLAFRDLTFVKPTVAGDGQANFFDYHPTAPFVMAQFTTQAGKIHLGDCAATDGSYDIYVAKPSGALEIAASAQDGHLVFAFVASAVETVGVYVQNDDEYWALESCRFVPEASEDAKVDLEQLKAENTDSEIAILLPALAQAKSATHPQPAMPSDGAIRPRRLGDTELSSALSKLSGSKTPVFADFANQIEVTVREPVVAGAAALGSHEITVSSAALDKMYFDAGAPHASELAPYARLELATQADALYLLDCSVTAGTYAVTVDHPGTAMSSSVVQTNAGHLISAFAAEGTGTAKIFIQNELGNDADWALWGCRIVPAL